MANIETAMFYPGVIGIMNQSIADAQKLSKKQQTTTDSNNCDSASHCGNLHYYNGLCVCLQCDRGVSRHLSTTCFKQSTACGLKLSHFHNNYQTCQSIDTQLQSCERRIYSDALDDEIFHKSVKSNDVDNFVKKSAQITAEVSLDNIELGVRDTNTGCRVSRLGDRRVYDRERILSLRTNSLSRAKPQWTPSNNKFTDKIILDYLIRMNGQKGLSVSECTRQHNISISEIRRKSTDSWDRSTERHVSVPRFIDLGVIPSSLERSEDGYMSFKEKLSSGFEIGCREESIRHIKGVLNRIVPENFDQCLSDLLSLKVDNIEDLECLVNELFSKAVREESYSVIFADLCSKLSFLTVMDRENEMVTFREVLLQKCHTMFITPIEEQLKTVRESCYLTTSVKNNKYKALIESDVEERVNKAKDEYYGNIRFIGELYIKDILATTVLCFCIDYLWANAGDSESLVCLCKLLSTCGSKLEVDINGQQKFVEIVSQVQQLLKSGTVASRVRFKILDFLELRSTNWNFRKNQRDRKIEPKTLQEIKLE